MKTKRDILVTEEALNSLHEILDFYATIHELDDLQTIAQVEGWLYGQKNHLKVTTTNLVKCVQASG